jgi:hypothetical protein
MTTREMLGIDKELNPLSSLSTFRRAELRPTQELTPAKANINRSFKMPYDWGTANSNISQKYLLPRIGWTNTLS